MRLTVLLLVGPGKVDCLLEQFCKRNPDRDGCMRTKVHIDCKGQDYAVDREVFSIRSASFHDAARSSEFYSRFEEEFCADVWERLVRKDESWILTMVGHVYSICGSVNASAR